MGFYGPHIMLHPWF